MYVGGDLAAVDIDVGARVRSQDPGGRVSTPSGLSRRHVSAGRRRPSEVRESRECSQRCAGVQVSAFISALHGTQLDFTFSSLRRHSGVTKSSQLYTSVKPGITAVFTSLHTPNNLSLQNV